MKAHKIEDENNLTFDTLKFAKRAESVGFTKEQSEFQAEEIVRLIDTQLATKIDLKTLELALKQDLKTLELVLKQDIKNLELRMTIKLGSMLVIAVSILIAVLKWH